MTAIELDAIDRRIVNTLQGGFPFRAPYAKRGGELGIGEAELISTGWNGCRRARLHVPLSAPCITPSAWAAT